MTPYQDGGEYWARYEDLIAAFLLRSRRAQAVVKVAHGATWAPMLDAWASTVGAVQDSGGRRIILPDLQWHPRGAGPMRWGEVKYKTVAPTFYKAKQVRTGIDLRVFRHYQRIEELTGYPVDLFFCHRVEGEVRIARLTQEWMHGVGGGETMVYWDWASLPRLCTMAELERLNPIVSRPHLGIPLFAPRAVQPNLFDSAAP